MEGASSSSFPGTSSSFVILCVSIVGIMSITLLMLAYYLFLTRCGLLFFWRADQSISVVSVTVHEEAPPRRSRSGGGGGGLEEAAIRRIPTFRYRSHDDAAKKKQQQQECAVCLGDFGDGERIRLLPPCRHAFHIDCIDAWLHATATCPLCRAAVVDVVADDVVVIDIVTAADAAYAAAEQPHPSSSSSSSLPLPMRRSLSMDSSTDKRFYLALQRIIQHQQQHSSSPAATQQQEAKGDSAAAAAADRSSSRRLRRSFFSFSQSRGSRSAILPL
ncbi:unnamed protein product [Urochloa humidicola]